MPSIPKASVKPGYQAQSINTSVDTDVLMFNLPRRISAKSKAERIQKIDYSIRQISPVKLVIEDPISLATKIAEILDRIQIPYYIEGSLASSLWGEPRYSEDLDLVIEILPEQGRTLVESFNQQI